MTHIINNHEWNLPNEVLCAAKLQATKDNLQFVYLSERAKKDDIDFLFFKDEELKHPAFVIDKRDI